MNESGSLNFSKSSGNAGQLRILLVDDHTMLLEGINNLLEKEHEIIIVGKAAGGNDAIALLKQIQVDLVITDLHMPGMDGLALYNYIKQHHPSIKTIVLSMHDEVHIVKEVLKAGVDGYVLKKDTHKELLKAIEEIKSNGVYISSEVNKVLEEGQQRESQKPLLTAREIEIVRLIAREYSNKKIGEELFISERTVETHRKNILRKTGVASVVGLIKYAYANKIL